MKLRVFALVLALSFVVWAQESPSASAPNSTPVPEAKSCCHHMDSMKGEMKDGEGCCHHAKNETKMETACCGKDSSKCEMKDAKSCCEGKDMKACKKECKKNAKSCGSSTDKSAKSCCGHGSQHEHAPSVS